MESTPTPSPLVKHESVSESFPSLFGNETSTPATMDPSALFSDDPADCFSPGDFGTPGPDDDLDPSDDKKPTKKRKSWGQVLPEPKTNLPPRKRAKTDDEKEQRRVERVLRNRRAAQSSRERKRQETEALAQKNKDLEAAVIELQRANTMLQQELKKVRPDLGGAAAPSSNSMTLSQPLFPSHEMNGLLQPSQASMDLIEELVNKSNQTPKTVNPASISPALTPVPEEPEFEPATEELNTAAPRAAEASQTDDSSPLTQYPAAVLCFDAVAASSAAHVPATPVAGVQLFGNASLPVGDASVGDDLNVYESLLASSPNASDLDFDHFSGDQQHFDIAFDVTDVIDVDQWINNPFDSGDGAFDNQQQLSLQDPAAPNPAQDSNLQPTAGASSSGCDARGIAVESH
ncbi:transcription factor that binds to CRE motif [Diaporthe australafricana]|uniref:Transcription factor that binds to CRE motif n=1 Tax=Diaporthe australafricana TaxID=127596 RepID=A0ABR3WKK7_9PEZI